MVIDGLFSEFIEESVKNGNIQALEQVESEIQEVIEFTRTRTIHLNFYKQAMANVLLVQNGIARIINK